MEPIKTASELVDWLFTNSDGRKADRIVLRTDHPWPSEDITDIGTHSRSAVLAKVEELLASQWMPIAEAPRDGTRILIWSEEKGTVLSVYWDNEFDSKWDDKKEETNYVGAWTDDAVQSFGYEEVHSYNPALFQVLPAPPEES